MEEEYIYQPNATIIKAGLQNKYANHLGLKKLHANTQLYIGKMKIVDFMGRIFHVKEYINANKKEIQRIFPLMKANIITKNYPLSPEEMMKKFKLKSGGDKYLIAFTGYKNKKHLASCNRIKFTWRVSMILQTLSNHTVYDFVHNEQV